MNALLAVLCSVSIGLALDQALRRLLIWRAEKNVEKTLRLQGWTEVDVTIGIHPLPFLAGCFWTWRFTRRQYRAERQRRELEAKRREALRLAAASGFITPNEARDLDQAA